MRISISGSIFFLLMMVSLTCLGQEGDTSLPLKRGVFSIGFSPSIVLNSYENFSALGNEKLLQKKNFASTQSVDREGRRNRNVKNFFFGVSLMYKLIDRGNNFWGFDLGYERGNTAFAYLNLETFNFPTSRSSTVNSWISWNVTNNFSLSVVRAWGKREDLKWYAKLKTAYVRLASIEDKKTDFTEEWLNELNTGGIWEGRVLNKNSVAFTPEFGRQITKSTKSRDLHFFIGLGYQLNLFEMYELNYYSVEANRRSAPNKIKVRGNNLAIKLSVHVPISTKAIVPRQEKKVAPKKEVIAKDFSQNNLVFLLDVSISMAQDGKLDLLKQYMTNMLDSLPPYDYITIITFSGNTKLVLKPTQVIDKEEILSKLENIVPKGGTDANRGIKKAYGILRKNYIDKGNNRIIVATDGVFKTNKKSRALITDNLADKNIKLSVFHFVGDRTTSAFSLKELAAIGGGNYALVNETNITEKLAEEYKQKVD